MENLKRSKKFGYKLLVPSYHNVLTIEPELFALCITLRLYFLIMSLLLVVFGIKKVLETNIY